MQRPLSSSEASGDPTDEIVRTSLDLYDHLPRHGKPVIRPNGVPEWTILATISLVTPQGRIIPVSLGSGVKVISASKLPPLGDSVHDSHAEIVARRGFVRWLIEEARRVSQGETHFGVVEWDQGVFRLVKGVQIWLYVSTIPCGDASTSHTAAYQSPEMALLKAESQKDANMTTPAVQAVRGRDGYQNYGAIRTKPGRADSVPSISLSCSDKIASWSVLGLQGGLLASLFGSVYLTGVIVGGIEDEPPDGFDLGGREWKDLIRGEIERATWGRLTALEDRLPSPYTLHKLVIHLTSIPFIHSKPLVALANLDCPEPVTTGLSISHIPILSPIPDVIYNGCKTGRWVAPGFTLMKERNRPAVCRYETFRAFLELVEMVSLGSGDSLIDSKLTYYQLKHLPESPYQSVKTLLRGVPQSSMELHESFGKIQLFEVTGGSLKEPVPPFAGWIVAGRKFQSFTKEGQVVMYTI